MEYILQKGKKLILFEVKTNNEVKESYVRYLNWFEEELGDNFKITKVLLNTGKYAYIGKKYNVHVIPITLLGA